MKIKKFLVLFSLCIVFLFTIAYPVSSQTPLGTVYIRSNGSIESSTNATVPIQQNGNIYTLTDDLIVNAFVIQRGGITIEGAGYKIQGNSEYGIDLTTINQVTISNIQVEGFFYGIYLYQSSGNTITGNTLNYCGKGIEIINCTQNTITNNVITDNDFGLELVYTSGNIFRNNQLDNNNNIAIYGIEFSHFNNDMDESNTISGNKRVYYLIGEENLVINPQTYPDVGFIGLVGCSNIVVENIDLTNNGQGILLVDTTGSTISQNNINDNNVGIMLFSSTSNTITGNIITRCYRGIQLSESSTANNIGSNTVINNTGGMFLYDSPLNTVSGNTISDNRYAIGFDSSSNNLIRGNYFLENELQIYDASEDNPEITISMNTWHVSYPVGGNYWSDYLGIDVKKGSEQNEDGSDFVGDTPHIINAYNQDSYPLIPENSLYVYITRPENKSYNADSLTLTYTVSVDDPTIKYSLDEKANVTISGNTKISNLTDGHHKITIFAQDSEGNQASHSVYFTISDQGETPTDQDTDSLSTILIIVGIAAIAGVVILYFLKIRKK